MRLTTTLLLFLMPASAFAQPQGALENPSEGSVTSGIYMFSGWVCEADEVEIVIDGTSGIKAAYGTSRGDTQGVCGDSDNGFGLLFNMSLMGTGEHTAVAFADGQEFGRSTFYVQRLSTGEFLAGAQGFTVDQNFPKFGREVWLEWVQSAQNFIISWEQDTPNPLDISGGWYSDVADAGALVSTSRFYANREEVWVMLAIDNQTWNIFEGYIQGYRARLRGVAGYSADIDVTVDFSDTENGVVKVNSCSNANGYICLVSAGDSFPIRKIVGNVNGAYSGPGHPVLDADLAVPFGSSAPPPDGK